MNGGFAATNALALGFAVISSDAGHSGTQNPTFGIDPQARLDYGYQAAATLTPMAKAAIKTAYGKAPDRSYFGGCSNGGRHTLVAAAREPDQYDGYLVGDPGFRLPLAAVANIVAAQGYASVASTLGDVSTGFTVAERKTVVAAVLAKCDALDGATDGLVQDTAACKTAFDLARDVPTCTGARDGSCLTAAQKTVIGRRFGGETNGVGNVFYSSWPYDAGIGGSNTVFWSYTAPLALDSGAVGLIWEVPPENPTGFNGPAFALAANVDAMLAKIQATSATYPESAFAFMIPPHPSDLGILKNRGAKMRVYHGTSDPIFSSDDTTAWYESLRAANGGDASNFARFYRVPGMTHCSAGPATDQFDMLTPLVAWVEQGIPPESVVATARARATRRASTATFRRRGRRTAAARSAPTRKSHGTTAAAAWISRRASPAVEIRPAEGRPDREPTPAAASGASRLGRRARVGWGLSPAPKRPARRGGTIGVCRPSPRRMPELRTLVLVLGDQLDLDAAAFDGFDPAQDAVWMAEVDEESTHVWSTKARIAVFLTGMRHFAAALALAGRPLHYTHLDAAGNTGALASELRRAVDAHRPARLVMTAPGDWRVLRSIRAVAAAAGLALEIRPDRHFFATVREFAAYAEAEPTIRLESWYRRLRRRHGVLMDEGEPVGGRWNFDTENRKPFGRGGPVGLPERPTFEPDGITREVIGLVGRRFAEHPGTLTSFGWPATRADASVALDRFVAERLPRFGPYQDAMWHGEAWLLHSQLSSAMNLKLLDPHTVVAAAEKACRDGAAPLASVEGFVRQVLGWREYVRGIYWTQMPGYLQRNALDAHLPLPAWYWTGATDMRCLADAIRQTLVHGYAHHIQRLMVTGLYALLLGVDPAQVHAWYLAVYVDAVEWVEAPNTLGLSQYADGGLAGSKPYVASGRYIQKMSDHCRSCRFDPAQRTGARACPFTTLYWDFLMRHGAKLTDHPRMRWPLQNLGKFDAAERRTITIRAAALKAGSVAGA